jgi:flagellar hook-associated protein 2
MTSSVDGLISGLSTTQLVSQLMQVEALPQTALKNKLKSTQAVITAFQSVNTKVAALKTAADDMVSTLTWQAVRATSSSDSVSATAAAGAAVGETTFDVTRLARGHLVTVTDVGGAATSGGGLDITVGAAAPVHITVATDTLAGAATAINAAAVGVRASVVRTDNGDVLQLVATKSGAANAFTVAGTASTPNVAVAGADAQITFGDPDHGGYTASSASNSFTGVISGVTFTATKVQDDVTISVLPDEVKIADRMQALVDTANATLAEISKQTAYDAAAKSAAPLAGNFPIRTLTQAVLSSVSSGQVGYGSFKQVGVGLDGHGKLTFDRAVFQAAYQADPTKVQAAAGAGLGAAMQTVAKKATDSGTGTITTAIQSRNDSVRTLNDQIENWDVRLVSRRSTLQRQYANLEVILGKLQNQSSWLSGQIASLPTNG